MTVNNSVFAMDAGNTSLKVALFENEKLVEMRRFAHEDLDLVRGWMSERSSAKCIFCSVLSEDENQRIEQSIPGIQRIQSSHAVPFESSYLSPTLGIDRLCNAAYMYRHARTAHAVAIDIGTCIKFDLLHRDRGYLGGSIAPGIRLRYGVLHSHTGKLPLLSNKNSVPLVGTSTEGSIQSGVMNGIEAEIQGMITQYSQQFPDLTFFMTGGDAGFFEFHSKNNIFAVENLTLIGLFEIYRHNA